MSDKFYDTGAAGYDQTCGFACLEFIPTLLKLAGYCRRPERS